MNLNFIRKKAAISLVLIFIFLSISFSGCVNDVVQTGGWTHANEQGTQVIITGSLKIGTTAMAERLWFEWREKDSIYNTTISATGTGRSAFNAISGNLIRVRTYEYRACVLKDGTTYWGNWVECKSGLPAVSAGDVLSVDWDQKTAIVSGTLNNMGGASSCSVIVRYGIHDSRGLHTESKKLYNSGYFEIEIDHFPKDAYQWGFGWYVEVSNDVGSVYSSGPYIHPPE